MTVKYFNVGRRWKTLTLVAAAVAILGMPGQVLAGPATEQVKGTVDQVLKILTDPSLKGERKTKERRAQLRKTVLERFDFSEMSKRSMGRYWGERTPEERTEFVGLFTDLLERAYVDRVEGYTGEQILYLEETTDGNYSEVRTKIVTKRNQEIPITYRLQRADSKWSVYDIVVEGVSLVNNYRTQFSKIIRTSSYQELVKKMQAKNEGEERAEIGDPKSKVR
ncbi:organic solvent tolerance ABC transporter substrate-binding protein [Candidatus Methylomirabilis lanthanidiphila]|uniref:Organic solvent tolerance ABC transporter substrate-binding protein n=1 Tax=Candidatus Methylomirabilis lanthanidiphila TaxID=2211376 RepID=A0A564ZHS8_9BACT|nr:ABC transporter substrate-binding protein [Candidatus Methylomirabilis lanthanidiphila]VUZ84098.1 organic solvent tolerance ABC transporter substrate-binding protein [Candidatus Methylomirabilis lanthanidiphila]